MVNVSLQSNPWRYSQFARYRSPRERSSSVDNRDVSPRATELVYDTTVVIQAALNYQSWSWTTSTEILSSGRSGLVCSLLQWINALYQLRDYYQLRDDYLSGLYWQAGLGQWSPKWAILDSSMVLHGAFSRGNLEGLMWSLMHSWRVFAKQLRWNLTTQKVRSVSHLLFWTLWMCSNSTSRLVICNQSRNSIWQ